MVTDISNYKDKEEMKTALKAAGQEPKERTYAEYKTELDNELQKQAEGFVRVGYLLKVARDTNVLAESGYKSVAEFAQAEYGLSKDVVSRYIAINDRYSENGYSDRLQTKYEGYGYSKLTEMLTLPEEIISEIEPSLTRKEIQEIKKEVAEEEKISPIEVAMEAAEEKTVEEEKTFSLCERVWLEHYRENKPEFLSLKEAIATVDTKKLMDVLAPYGNTVKWARVPGVDKMMISISSAEQTATITNIRSFEKLKESIEDILADLIKLFGSVITKHTWEKVYSESFDKPEKKESIKKPESVIKNPENDIKKPESVIKTEENVIEPTKTEQIEEDLNKTAKNEEEKTDEGTGELHEAARKDDNEAFEAMPEPTSTVGNESGENEEHSECTDKPEETCGGVLGRLEVVREVAPMQQEEAEDTKHIIEIREEIKLEKYGMNAEMPLLLRKSITVDSMKEKKDLLIHRCDFMRYSAEDFKPTSEAIYRSADIKNINAALAEITEAIRDLELLNGYLKEIEREEREKEEEEEED